MIDEGEHIYVNGIDGATGEYLVRPLTTAEAAGLARNKPLDGGSQGWLKRVWEAMRRPFMGLPIDIDPMDVAQAGWAVVFADSAPAEVREALGPLIRHRQSQIPEDRCKQLNHQADEGVKEWLRRHGVYPGSVAPAKVPYYLLLVGDATAIPFAFQCLLDIEYAVGRLAFDTADQYRQYAESVIEYETSRAVPNSREIVYWGTRHPADRATQTSADHLITPLYEGIAAADDRSAEAAIAASLSYRSRCFRAQDATKANLAELLHAPHGARRPAMLFTASHGMGWPLGHEYQKSSQGALLCQDWSGFGGVEPAQLLAGADVEDDARLHGLVAFFFACYGAGTPQRDAFLTDRGREPQPIAETAFVAALPQRLLSHPQGGALAVLGHVERAWAYSIRPPGVGTQLQPFRNLIARILSGQPVGNATKDFSERFAMLSAELLSTLDDTRSGPRPTDRELAQMWIERNDAENYVILADPAVRVRTDLLVDGTA
jgi:hypothetical protein